MIKVYATLSKVPPPGEHIKGDATADDGASYLLAPRNAERLEFKSSDGKFWIKKNRGGELSFLEFECSADCIATARRAFMRAVLPIIDHISYVNDCPIFVASIRFDDTKNHRQTLDYISPYRHATVGEYLLSFDASLKPVYAMYREAKNSSSNFYRFMCYYKILEGLLGKMRPHVFKVAKERLVELKSTKQFVPDHPELPDSMRLYVGKAMKDFFDNVLGPRFRNAVAHFVADDGGVLDMSAPEHLESYAETILISEMCARAVIADHEALLIQLL